MTQRDGFGIGKSKVGRDLAHASDSRSGLHHLHGLCTSRVHLVGAGIHPSDPNRRRLHAFGYRWQQRPGIAQIFYDDAWLGNRVDMLHPVRRADNTSVYEGH